MKRTTPLAAACAALLALAACQDAIVSDPDSQAAPAGETQLHRGYILRDGQPLEVVYEVHDGRALIEGDIDLGPAGSIARTRDELLRRQREGKGPRFGVVTDNSSRRWVNGVVGYVIESNVGNQSRIHSAIAHIEANVGGVDFQPYTNHSSYIIFRRTTDPNICGSSAVGRQGGGQVLLIRDDCQIGSVMHEMGHALGFEHEHSRCDRDSYVQILTSNIRSGYSGYFVKHCTGADDIGTYDEGSIMHYRHNAFGQLDAWGNEMTTINSLRGMNWRMGQRDTLSSMDVYTLNVMYRPYGPANYAVTYPGGVPSFSWSASPRATSYKVYLTEITEEWIMDYGTFTYEYNTEVATTAGTSVTDPGHAYTGVDQCTTYNSAGYVSTKYWYDLYAYFPNGVVSQVARADAKVATC